MVGIINKNVYYVVFEKKACLLALCPDEPHAPCYPTPVVMLLYCNSTEAVSGLHLVVVNKSPVSRAANEKALKGVSHSNGFSGKRTYIIIYFQASLTWLYCL